MRAILCTLCLASLTALSQPPDTLWTANYGMNNEIGDYIVCFSPTSDGGFLLGTSSGYGCRSWTVSSYLPSGTMDWADPTYDFDFDLVEAISNQNLGYYACGYLPGWDCQQEGIGVRLLDATNTILWDNTYYIAEEQNGIIGSMPNDFVQTDNGSIIAVGALGIINDVNEEEGVAFVLYIDAAGDTLWSAVRHSGWYSSFEAVDLLPDDRIACLGADWESSNPSRSRIILELFEPDGEMIWSHEYGDSASEISVSDILAVSADEFVVLVYGSYQGHDNARVLSLNSQGETNWIYETADRLGWTSLVSCPAGGYAFITQSDSSTGSHLRRLSPTGEELWAFDYFSEDLRVSHASHLIALTDSSYVIAGFQRDSVGWIHVIKTAPDLTQITSTEEPRSNSPYSYSLTSYPNPFNPATTIEFDVPVMTDVSLRVYDVQGRLVKELLNERVAAGSHRVEFNGESYPSGLYFARMQTGAQTITRKMLLIK